MNGEEVALLTEIRDLLRPISSHYEAEYSERLAARDAARRQQIAELVRSAKRRKAWDLADGTRTQREISKQVSLDEGSTSRLFKALRELGAVEGDAPRRTVVV